MSVTRMIEVAERVTHRSADTEIARQVTPGPSVTDSISRMKRLAESTAERAKEEVKQLNVGMAFPN